LFTSFKFIAEFASIFPFAPKIHLVAKSFSDGERYLKGKLVSRPFNFI
jgi:hypothetical protein